MAVVFRSNLDFVLKNVRANTKEAAEAAGEIAVDSVHKEMLYGYHDLHGRPPHTEIADTDALYDSISADVKKVSQNAYTVSVGTPLKYGKYVHDGYDQPAGLKFQDKDGNWYTTKGGHIQGRPFLRDGIMNASDELYDALGERWKEGL